MALQYTWGNILNNSFHVLTDDTHITCALLKMVIKILVFFKDRNENLTGYSLKLNCWTDFMTRANVFTDQTEKSTTCSLEFILLSSFSPFLNPSSRCTLPCWQVQACGCYDSLSEYIHKTLSLSIVLPLSLSISLSLPVSLSRKSCYSR